MVTKEKCKINKDIGRSKEISSGVQPLYSRVNEACSISIFRQFKQRSFFSGLVPKQWPRNRSAHLQVIFILFFFLVKENMRNVDLNGDRISFKEVLLLEVFNFIFLAVNDASKLWRQPQALDRLKSSIYSNENKKTKMAFQIYSLKNEKQPTTEKIGLIWTIKYVAWKVKRINLIQSERLSQS